MCLYRYYIVSASVHPYILLLEKSSDTLKSRSRTGGVLLRWLEFEEWQWEFLIPLLAFFRIESTRYPVFHLLPKLLMPMTPGISSLTPSHTIFLDAHDRENEKCGRTIWIFDSRRMRGKLSKADSVYGSLLTQMADAQVLPPKDCNTHASSNLYPSPKIRARYLLNMIGSSW